MVASCFWSYIMIYFFIKGGNKMIDHKRIARRNKLVKRLAVNLCTQFIGKIHIKMIKITVSEYNSTNCRYKTSDFSDIIININITQIYGLCKGKLRHYSNRDILLSKYKYKKALLRLAILHELYHSRLRLHKKIYGGKLEEIKADRFSIDRLKVLGIK